MCGLVALCGPVPPEVTNAAVAGAAARGPHTSGLATWERGRWTVSHAAGRLDRWTIAPRIGTVLVGHARLATSTASPGDAPDPAEGQPLVDGPRLVAHNGTLSGDELDVGSWAAGAGDGPYDGPVDSGAILNVLAAGGPASAVLDRTEAPQAALWSDGEWLYAGRWSGRETAAHPLYRAHGTDPVSRREWAAVSSGPLPGGWLIEANMTTPIRRLP